MKCIVCSERLGTDPLDSVRQQRCWHHVLPEPRAVVFCRLLECEAESAGRETDGYCAEHWANLQSWMNRSAA